MNTQMNSAVRKIHNLLTSGAVTVTGPNQPRILKHKVGSTTVSSSNSLQHANNSNRCYVCDDALNSAQAQHPLTDMETSHTSTKFPNKIGQLVGEAFMVIVSVEDVVCSRCTNLINYLDRLENDVERVRTNLINLLHRKYGINDEGGGTGGGVSPPTKMQKLNSGAVSRTAEETSDVNRTRKIQHTTTASESAVGKQTPPVSAVQQIKIPTQPSHQQTAGTQTLQRKTTKIYKCLSCDYKTSDMRLFNTHYETCKQQNFQCKNCKKIFPNFGTMKQHMVREHNTAMDHTCAICHINFVNEVALRKHMEANHSTNVVVTSTTTLPAVAPAPAVSHAESTVVTSTALYTCNHCQLKSTDKAAFDEHMRKHLTNKPKPFKCRVCAQRFETREAATIHAKQHQPNYFKCGTCAMSFPKREQLVKHFEVHSTDAAPTTTIAVKSTQQSQNLLTTQKLLQDTINEALSDSVNITTTTASNSVLSDVASATVANNIRFFSCHICSLTFIQENYYNQHMETHRPDKKIGVSGNTTTIAGTTITNSTSLPTLGTAAQALLSEASVDVGIKKSSNESNSARHLHSNTTGATTSISEVDIESIFEKMHSDKGDSVATSADHTITTNTASSTSGTQGSDNLVITSQEGTGGISFNITIPQPDTDTQSSQRAAATPVSVSIDMPMLDQPDEVSPTPASAKDEHPDTNEENDTSKGSTAAGPVSMPSLEDDNDTQEEAPSTTAEETDAASSENTADTVKSNEQTKEERTNSEDAKISEEQKIENETSATEGEQQHSDGGGESEDQQHHEGAGSEEGHVAMELDEAMQAQVESGQIKFILNENGQLLQLDNHIITDADGNQILVQDPEQIQQLLQSVGVLQSGDGLDGETLQMMTDANGQMVLVHGENNETQLIDASLLNADGQLVIQQGQDGELGEGAHVIGEDGTRIPVSVSYTADGQPIVQVQQQVLENVSDEGHHEMEKDTSATDAEEQEQSAGDASSDGRAGGNFFALEDLMQHSSVEAKADE